MKEVLFVTSSIEKMIDANGVCEPYGVKLVQATVRIDEIQHHDPKVITRSKAHSAYGVVGQPVVVNDSFWSIPALNGFPGGYMKDVNDWLSTSDWQALMEQKQDRSIILYETVAYYDGQVYVEFTESRPGKFLHIPTSSPGTGLGNVVAMDCDKGKTINQVFQLRRSGGYPVLADNYSHWKKFADWYNEDGFKLVGNL